MISTIEFLAYEESCIDRSLRLFDENCPRYFSESEKEDYAAFLRTNPSGYFVGAVDQGIVSAFGLITAADSLRGRLTWILVAPASKGDGLGTKMMSLAKKSAQEKDLCAIDIAASHLSAPFFKKFGAQPLSETVDGWGQGMHRIDMELKL